MTAHEPSGPRLEISNRRPDGWLHKTLRAFFVMGLVGLVAGGAAGIEDRPQEGHPKKVTLFQPGDIQQSVIRNDDLGVHLLLELDDALLGLN